MHIDRRALLTGATGASALLATGRAGAAAAADPSGSLAPLLRAGLDPFDVYRQMFASTADRAETCWWYFGALPFHVDDVGQVAAFQEETARAHLIERVSPDRARLRWREAGVFREFTTGEVPTSWFDPVTGARTPHGSTLGGPQAEYLLDRRGQGLTVSLRLPEADVHSVTLAASVEGDRVALTQVENKTRVMGPAGRVTLLATLRAYSSLAELKSGAPSVASRGYYSVTILDTGKVFVAGPMQKTAMDEKLNPIAWERVRAAAPSFFKGDRISPAWT